MTDHPIASEKSFEVFELRRRRGELITPALDKTNQVIQAGRIVLDAYPADRPAIGDSFQGEAERQLRFLREGC